MKKIIAMTNVLAMCAALTACGSSDSGNTSRQTRATEAEPTVTTVQTDSNTTKEISDTEDNTELADTAIEITDSETQTADTLVVYFSRVGNTDFPDDIDAVSSASLARINGELKGNAQMIAEWIADEAGADIFEVQSTELYPIDYDATTDVAKQEQNDNARPELYKQLDGLDSYSTVYIVFPNWWADLPMPMYSFFDSYDFSGKKMPIFVTHGGSSFSGTISTIKGLEPSAEIIEGLSIYHDDVAGHEAEVRDWARNNG